MADLSKFDRPVVTDNQQMEWTSDVPAEMLRRLGIKYISLNPGASYRGFHDSMVNYLGNSDPQMLLCLHEDHALSIAHGYASVTEQPMAAAVHSNVGLLHGLMGVFNAWCDRAPILLMGATGPVDAPLRRPWIDWIHTAKDQGALLRNFTKWDDEPRSAEATVESMLRANMIARTAPKGPVYVCLDAGLQEEKLTGPVTIPDMDRFKVAESPRASEKVVNEAADALINAKSPVLMMGRVSRSESDWDNRVKLAEMLGARVITDIKNCAAFPTNHGLHVGPPSNWIRDESKDLLEIADVIVGFDWIDLAGVFKALGVGFKHKAKVINCTVDQYVHNGWSMDYFGLAATDLMVLVEPDVFIGQLLEAVTKKLDGKQKWDGERVPGALGPEVTVIDKEAGDTLWPRDIAIALNGVKKGRKITLTRVNLGWAGETYHFTHPLDFLGNDGGGGLGSGAGNAIGAGLALLDSDRIPVAVLGDGDFMQGGTALWTAAHYSIPVLIIIANNRSNFNDEVHQEAVAIERNRPKENRWIGQRIDDPPIDLAAFAKSQGVDSAGPIETAGELPAAIEAALKVVESGKPFFLDVRVVPGYSTPMVTRASGEASTGTAS
ncbi:MAG: thiamine pyrophosphate-binding protein [Rhodospirillales bacterium]|nr:thiamine pyrophosphate-binding protein [Rhodospirillales bacterium]